jgi:hypothetical protein
MALQQQLPPRRATRNGIWLAISPAEPPCVTSSPKSWRSICAISTSLAGLGEGGGR